MENTNVSTWICELAVKQKKKIKPLHTLHSDNKISDSCIFFSQIVGFVISEETVTKKELNLD